MARGDGRGVTPTVLFVAARSGSGKTTLLERVVAILAARGVRVAAVKRTHHDVDPDPAGKDTRRLRDAGAAPVALCGPRLLTVTAPAPPADAPEAERIEAAVRAVAAVAQADLVVVEGGRSAPGFPRVEVVPPGGSVTSDAALLVAVATDGGPAPSGVPEFRRDDADGVARAIAARFGLLP